MTKNKAIIILSVIIIAVYILMLVVIPALQNYINPCQTCPRLKLHPFIYAVPGIIWVAMINLMIINKEGR